MIGIFGGTFDPVHLGHRKAIDQLCSQVGFNKVHWVLSARPPHKDQVTADIFHRYEMLQLELSDNSLYEADDTEIKRAAKSYTIDTVEVFKDRFPGQNLVVIIGGDSLHNLHTWHRYEDLMASVNWIVMNRPGYSMKVPSDLRSRLVESPADLGNQSSGAIWLYESTEFAISSTQLRKELSCEAETPLSRKYLSTRVSDYIRGNRLYQLNVVSTDEQTNLYNREEHPVVDESMNSDQIKNQVVEALENVKGQDIKVLDIAEISDFADFMIVVSGTSDTHVKALARSASDELRSQGVKPLNEDGSDVGEWVLVDFGDVVLHVMRPEVRAYYDLEKLWDEDVRKMVEQHREERDQ